MFSTYDEFNNNAINDVNKLNYKFILNDRFIYVTDNDGQYFSCQTPFLKVLKPIHITLNKKKTISKKYLILETNDELDFNNQIGEFMFIINKIHEVSQEKIRKNSIQWFNTEFDDIGLDIKVRRPIDQQKDSEFIKISIPIDSELEKNIENLKKGDYILCDIIFKGLKIANDSINEEWEIKNYITQEKFDELENKIPDNTVELIEQLVEEEINSHNNINDNPSDSNNEQINQVDINNEEINHVDINNDKTEIDIISIAEDNNTTCLEINDDMSILTENLDKFKENFLKKTKLKKHPDLVRKFSKKLIFN